MEPSSHGGGQKCKMLMEMCSPDLKPCLKYLECHILMFRKNNFVDAKNVVFPYFSLKCTKAHFKLKYGKTTFFCINKIIYSKHEYMTF